MGGRIELCDPGELVHIARKGEIGGLDRITRCYGDRLIEVGRHRCGNEEEAQDAVQDALLAAGRNLGSFRGDGSLEGWLVRMVINACHRMRRGRKNNPELHASDVELLSEEASPEERAFQGEVAEALGRALLELKAQDRMILLLAEGEGWTGPEIARKLGMTPGAVRTRLTRIRKKLREELSNVRRELSGEPAGGEAG